MFMNSLHSRFLAILPRIEAHATFAFRDIRCHARRADQIAETIALCWKWYVRLSEHGKDASSFVWAFAALASRAVRAGRRIAGMEKAKDVMNRRTQTRRGFVVEKLPDFSLSNDHPFTEALTDNMVTPPPDAAAFRLDFPRWLAALSRRDRRLAEQLMLGERPGAAAKRFGISPARVSQMRRELSMDWSRFHGEPGAWAL